MVIDNLRDGKDLFVGSPENIEPAVTITTDKMLMLVLKQDASDEDYTVIMNEMNE